MYDPTDCLQEETISSTVIFRGNLLKLRIDKVSLPDGRTARREIIEHPSAAAIVPVTDDGQVLLVRQWRHPIQQVTLEIPAGVLEAGEDPRHCAARELSEETCHVPGELRHLITMYLTPGYSDEIIHLYLASKLQYQAKDHLMPDEDENLQIMSMPMQQAVAECTGGKISDGKTIVGILLAYHALQCE